MIDESKAAAWAAIGWAAGGPIGALGAGLVSIFADAGGSLEDLFDALSDASFLLDLQPTQRKIAENVNLAGIASSGMRLRLAVVALEDGELYYVTESSRLLRGRAVAASFDEPISDPSPLIVGAMASAAIPGFFQARRLTTTSSSMHYVDGGVREVLPAQAAVELGGQLIFSISAAPFAPKPQSDPFGSPGMMLPIMKRGVDLAVSEVSQEEKSPRSGFCDQRERLLIQPNVEVHGTIEIDPGLIRVNMGYGYFRAFDADQLRRDNVDAVQYLLWQLWTDDLIEHRTRCAELEVGPEMQRARASGFFTHWVLEELRYRKNRIAEFLVQRFNAFGPEAFPRKLSHAVLGDQSTLDWCEKWEVHQQPMSSFLSTVDLWTPQVVAPGSASDDPDVRSFPPVTEDSITERYPLPAQVRDGLRHR